MLDPVRQEVAATADTIVIKVGTRVLCHDDGRLDDNRVTAIAEQLVWLIEEDRQVVLVSSGAVGAGLSRLGLAHRPSDLAQLQAVAAIGQSRLIEAYQRALEPHGRSAAQVLLTADDLNDRARYLNVRNTLRAVFQYGAVPIVNENDTVRVDELQRNVGDNDRLAAMVTNLLRAPLLVLLSDVDGLHDGDPRRAGTQTLPLVTDVDAAIDSFQQQSPVGSGANHLSKGGMASKLDAARLATAAGENVIIANGRRPNVLMDIVAGAPVGTLLLAGGPAVTSRKRWIGLTAQPCGKLLLDNGAAQAIQKDGRSLLAVGVSRVEGEFRKGDVVAICREDGAELARGLINYDAADVARIAGQSTDRISQILGHCPYDEVVHRDNLTLTR